MFPSFLLVCLPFAGGNHAVPVSSQEEQPRGKQGRLAEPGTERGRWLDELFRLPTSLAERGVSFSFAAVTDASVPFAGGVRQRGAIRTLLDATAELDLETAFGIPSSIAFAEFYALRGRDGSRDVGDAQAFSNIDGPEVTRLAALWVGWSWGRRGSVRLGKQDANESFAHVHAGLEFLHSSAGYSPAVAPLPTYPDPTFGLQVFAAASSGLQIGLGAFNARDGGVVSGTGLDAGFREAFLIGQAEWKAPEGSARRWVVGAWHHTGRFERFDGTPQHGSRGAYAVVEEGLCRPDRNGRVPLVGFLQWGRTESDVHEIAWQVGAGIAYEAEPPKRDGGGSWRSGAYLSRASFSNDPAAGLGEAELVVELFQEIPLAPGLALKPDLQWIHDPSGRDDLADAWVLTLRVVAFL